MLSERPRLPYIDLQNARDVIAFRAVQVPRLLGLLQTEPSRLRQRRLASLVDHYRAIGLCKYALGFHYDEVRHSLSRAIACCVEVFRLRGTQEAFPALRLTVDPTKPRHDPDRATLRPLHPPGTVDCSLTNSKDAGRYVCLALGIGDQAAACELASLTWDPPGADYIGRKSTVCTPNDQAFAYGLREFLASQRDAAMASLSLVSALPEDPAALQAAMLKALVQEDQADFLQALRALLSWNARRSRRDPVDVDCYVCAHALGLTALAAQARFVRIDELATDVYLPTALFASPGMIERN